MMSCQDGQVPITSYEDTLTPGSDPPADMTGLIVASNTYIHL